MGALHLELSSKKVTLILRKRWNDGKSWKGRYNRSISRDCLGTMHLRLGFFVWVRKLSCEFLPLLDDSKKWTKWKWNGQSQRSLWILIRKPWKSWQQSSIFSQNSSSRCFFLFWEIWHLVSEGFSILHTAERREALSFTFLQVFWWSTKEILRPGGYLKDIKLNASQKPIISHGTSESCQSNQVSVNWLTFKILSEMSTKLIYLYIYMISTGKKHVDRQL